MAFSPSSAQQWAERWDRSYEALGAEPSRMIMASLLDAPTDRRRPLPAGAESPDRSMDAEAVGRKLRHHHLPMLADAGSVRWAGNPFVVQRGSRFGEPAAIMERVSESVDDLSAALIDDCRIFRREVKNGTH